MHPEISSENRPNDDDAIAHNFSWLMLQGKIQNALRYLSQNTSGGVLSLDDLVPEAARNGGESQLCTTWDILTDKHPIGKQPEEGPY